MDFWNAVKGYLYSWLGIDLIMSAIEEGREIPAQAYVQMIFSCVTLVFLIFTCYKGFYLLVGLFSKARKFKPTDKKERYCYILSARNEERVIGNLIDSIREQDYPQELIDIYVIADNCSPEDRTKDIAEEKGCTVLVRNDPEHARKGYSLNLAVETIRKTVGLDAYYAYVFFDSDNVMAPDYLTKINDTFHAGDYGAVLGYINIKNLNGNWLTMISGMNFYRNVVCNLRPRSVLHTNVQMLNGTGFALRNYVLEKHGWNAFTISEDGEMTERIASEGVKFAFCEEAEFYDEQPETLKISLRQRLRWARGGLIVWFLVGPKMVKSFFKKPSWAKYDISWDTFPYALFSFLFSLTYQLVSIILLLCLGDNGYNWGSFWSFVISLLVGSYLYPFITGIVLLIREWKKMHFTIPQAILCAILWPFYDMSGMLIALASIFWKAKWKPIPHKSVASGKELQEKERNR